MRIFAHHEYEQSSFPFLQLTRRRSQKREQRIRANTSQEFSIAVQAVLPSYLILPYDIEGQKKINYLTQNHGVGNKQMLDLGLAH